MARLAQSADEVRRAQQLRFEVFNLELGEGLAESYVTGVDIDPFDEFSDHLMVEELATSEIVCTISRGNKLGRHDGVAIQVGLAGSAVQLRCPLAPASIQYALDHGSVADEVCYWRDMTLLPHLLNLFFKREIRSNCSFSPPRIRAGNRKEIARELREEILSMRS